MALLCIIFFFVINPCELLFSRLNLNPWFVPAAILPAFPSFQIINKLHSAGEAAVSRDSFAKALYDRLFTWIVGHVNSVIDPAVTDEVRGKKRKYFFMERSI